MGRPRGFGVGEWQLPDWPRSDRNLVNERIGLFASTQNEDPSELQLTVRESQSQGFGASLDVPESSMLPKTLFPGA